MTVSLRISKSKTLYLFSALLAAMAVATYAAQREVIVDTANYYGFYRDLIETGLVNIFSCQAFEPLFCIGSYGFSTLTGSEAAVHYLWTLVFYLVMLRAFLEFWPNFVSENTYSLISLATFLFVSINYGDPQAVYFLTRQYVASSFLMLGVARCLNQRNPLLPLASASLIHFGALPIAALLFLVTRRRIDLRLVLAAGAAGVAFIYYLAYLPLFDPYLDSVRVKVEAYATKNDGDVTIMQEIKLLLYWSASILMFKMARSNLVFAYILVYVFYLFTFQNDLYHLRYHKFLETMSWPSAFILFYIKKEASAHLVVGALSYRIYKYTSLFAPEAAAPTMASTLLLFFIGLVSWLWL